MKRYIHRGHIKWVVSAMSLFYPIVPEQESQLTPGKRATAMCVWRLVFAISTLFDAP